MRRYAVLLGALLVVGCAGTEPAPVPQRWDVELSTAPTLLALTDEQVYAASYGNGVGGSQLYRVDRRTGRLVEQRTLAGQPHGMAVGPDGALWVATLRLPDQPSGTGLQVVDPVTLQTRRRVDVAGVPLSVAFVGPDLWVGHDDGVRQVDPVTGEVRAVVATQHPANRLVPLGRDLVVVGPEAVQRVDTATRRAAAPRALPAAGSVTATGAGHRLWVLHPDERARSVLLRLDASTLAPVVTAPSPGAAGAYAHLAGDLLWVTDPAGRRLLCADADTGEVLAEQEAPASGPVAADGRTVVVARAGGVVGLPAECRDGD